MQSLNGDWSFKYFPGKDAGAGADFSKPGFDVPGWKKISVPSNWELKGFAEPKYALELEVGTGLYQRTFRLPAGWRDGRRACLRVASKPLGYEFDVNDDWALSAGNCSRRMARSRANSICRAGGMAVMKQA